MSNYIRESPKLAPINELLYHDDRYKKIRDRCNDHTHFNQFDIFIRNDNEVTTPPPAPVLDEFRSDLRAIFLLHLAYLFFLNDHYMMSTDYLDSLEYGIEPIEDSQYWVAPFVQEIFDSVLKKDRPDLAAAITQNTGMHLS
ncbi:MAG TPA: hypothetical protein PLO62_13840 [Candidatus Hydrogenedentes bacterium]|nr:hypothetical protein [Candidatus Hydrogenedentota bacterium]HOS03239.1 hypothetical protein [Candidatus Hydrogenedentota bacterium]